MKSIIKLFLLLCSCSCSYSYSCSCSCYRYCIYITYRQSDQTSRPSVIGITRLRLLVTPKRYKESPSSSTMCNKAPKIGILTHKVLQETCSLFHFGVTRSQSGHPGTVRAVFLILATSVHQCATNYF